MPLCSHCIPSCDSEKPYRSGCQKEALKYLSAYYRRYEPFKLLSSHTRAFSSILYNPSPLQLSSFHLFSDFTLLYHSIFFFYEFYLFFISRQNLCAKLNSHFKHCTMLYYIGPHDQNWQLFSINILISL